MIRVRRAALALMGVALFGLLIPAGADTIIFKDGSFIEGEVTLETSQTLHVKTRFGTRIYRRADVEEIMASVDSLDSEAVNKFSDLPAPVRVVWNAETELVLRRYEAALSRLEPLRRQDVGKALRMQIDWLIIEINERLGRWDEARALLEAKKQDGTPQEKIRAEARLSILDANPDYALTYVGAKHVRNFITNPDSLQRASKPNALAQHDLMRLALEEYCYQLLVEDNDSVGRFAEKLNADATYQACKTLPRAGDPARHLPYIDDLKKAEATLAKAQAVLGDYADPFAMDLVRTELYHLQVVLLRMLDEVIALSPETLTPGSDPRTGKLSKQGREQWRQRCDDFLVVAQPMERLIEYMLERVDHFPEGLRELRKALSEIEQRVGHLVKAVKKARDRTDA